MATRRDPVVEAARRARQHLSQSVTSIRDARRNAGISQDAVAAAIGCSRQLVGAIESETLDDVGCIQLARLAAVVGLDVSVRTFPGGSVLRDAGQLRLLDRFRASVGELWTWRTEVPVTNDPLDRRAIDAILVRPPHRVGVEAVTRLLDAQGQVRVILLKQQAAGLECTVIALANTRHNRHAVVEAEPSLRPAFPLDSRWVLQELRAGRVPPANGVVLV